MNLGKREKFSREAELLHFMHFILNDFETAEKR